MYDESIEVENLLTTGSDRLNLLPEGFGHRAKDLQRSIPLSNYTYLIWYATSDAGSLFFFLK